MYVHLCLERDQRERGCVQIARSSKAYLRRAELSQGVAHLPLLEVQRLRRQRCEEVL